MIAAVHPVKLHANMARHRFMVRDADTGELLPSPPVDFVQVLRLYYAARRYSPSRQFEIIHAPRPRRAEAQVAESEEARAESQTELASQATPPARVAKRGGRCPDCGSRHEAGETLYRIGERPLGAEMTGSQDLQMRSRK